MVTPLAKKHTTSQDLEHRIPVAAKSETSLRNCRPRRLPSKTAAAQVNGQHCVHLRLNGSIEDHSNSKNNVIKSIENATDGAAAR
jgi:hypothetical protein